VNSTHGMVGLGGTSAMAALTTLLTGWHGWDAAHAAAAGWLMLTALGSAYALGAWFIAWHWPAAPKPPDLVPTPPLEGPST
jgi:hypothetical protein